MNDNLSEAQRIILDVFAPIHKYLTEHGIEYYMLGGTLLGAIRHKGFIPWDDDIDIGIPRGQYEAFLEGIAGELPEHLRVETYKTNPEHHYYFSRIVDTRYQIIREGSERYALAAGPASSISFISYVEPYYLDTGLAGCVLLNPDNPDHPNSPLRDERVREAIWLLIDAQALNDLANAGKGTPCETLVSPRSWVYKPYDGEREVNIEKAKELLA